MFGILRLTRYINRVQDNHKRARMEQTFLDLPIHLQKDIGWPKVIDSPSPILGRRDQCCSPVQ